MGVDNLGAAIGQAMVTFAVAVFIAGMVAAAAIWGIVELIIYLVHHLHWA